MKNNSYTLVLFATLYFLPSNIYAADLERPTVTKAFDVFDQYPGSVPQGTLVTFKKKDTTLATHIIESGVQARVFALGDQDIVPKPIESVDNCDHYISTVIPLTRINNSEIMFSKVGEEWLNPTYSGRSVKDGRYYIVFEKVGPKQEHFRLRTSDRKAYFESGFLLVVKDNGTANLENVKNEYDKRKSRLESLYLEADDPNKKIPCYKYVRFAEVTEMRESSEELLALCEVEKLTN